MKRRRQGRLILMLTIAALIIGNIIDKWSRVAAGGSRIRRSTATNLYDAFAASASFGIGYGFVRSVRKDWSERYSGCEQIGAMPLGIDYGILEPEGPNIIEVTQKYAKWRL